MQTKDSANYDLRKLITAIKSKKKEYLIILGCSFIIGVVIAFSLPKNFTTKITLAPESNAENSLGSLSSLASLAGINTNSLNQDAIVPEIYPDVVRSTNFLVELSEIPVITKDSTISTTLYDYINTKQARPWWYHFFAIFSKKKEGQAKTIKNAFMLDRHQSDVIENIGNSISCSVDKQSGIIIIKASAQDALVSTIIADSVRARLQNFITAYRTNKARNDLENIQKLYKESKKNYDKARLAYAGFADANQELVLETYKTKETDLENEMQLKYNIYTQMTNQLQIARAKLIEKTPVYAVIQPAVVPIKKSGPKRLIIIFTCVLFGGLVYTLPLLYKQL